jgi:hypothetical protein
MRLKLLAVLLLAACVAAAGVLTASPAGVTGTSAATAPPTTATRARTPLPQDPEGTIDGAKNPEKISDQAAYSLLFRFLSGRKTEAEKKRARAYVRMMLRESGCVPLDVSEESRVDSLLAAAEEFHRKVSVLDRQAQEVKGNNRFDRSPEKLSKLKGLQKQKEVLVMEVVATLPGRLGADVAEKLRGHMNNVFKRKMKIRPNSKQQGAPAGPVAD